MKNSNNFIISIISLIHYSFSLFLPGLFPVFMGMVNVNSPGIHVLTRLISRRDKASDRIMSHGLAPLVHLWKQDPFFFSCLKEDAEWSQIAWTNFLRGMIDLPFEGVQGHTVGREGHVYFCLTVEKIFFRIVASFLEILKMRILFDYLGIINLRTKRMEQRLIFFEFIEDLCDSVESSL